MDSLIDVSSNNLHNKKNCLKLKNLLADNDEYISVSNVFKLIKNKTDLTSDIEIADFLIVNKIKDLLTPVDKFRYFNGKPMPLYKSYQNDQLSEMDLLLMEIAKGKIQLNSNDNRLSSFVWDKFDFFFEFNNLTGIDLEEEVIQDQLKDSTMFTEETSLEYYQKQNDFLRNENERLKAELIQAQNQIKRQELELLTKKKELNEISDDLKKLTGDIKLTGLDLFNLRAQDRQGMARVIASSLWKNDKNIRIGTMADKVYKIMVDYCKDELPGTSDTLKNWIRSVATEESQKKGRPKSIT